MFHSFRLIFGRAIIPRSALDAWMLFLERARAEHPRWSDVASRSSRPGALAPDPDDAAACLVHETFTAIVGGKRAANVNTNFFLCNVPVKQHTSATFAATFPKENRMIPQTRDDLKVVLNKAKSTGAKLGDALADFGALLFLMGFPQIFDSQFMPAVCASVVDRTLPLDEGYGLILYSFAGMDF